MAGYRGYGLGVAFEVLRQPTAGDEQRRPPAPR